MENIALDLSLYSEIGKNERRSDSIGFADIVADGIVAVILLVIGIIIVVALITSVI